MPRSCLSQASRSSNHSHRSWRSSKRRNFRRRRSRKVQAKLKMKRRSMLSQRKRVALSKTCLRLTQQLAKRIKLPMKLQILISLQNLKVVKPQNSKNQKLRRAKRSNKTSCKRIKWQQQIKLIQKRDQINKMLKRPKTKRRRTPRWKCKSQPSASRDCSSCSWTMWSHQRTKPRSSLEIKRTSAMPRQLPKDKWIPSKYWRTSRLTTRRTGQTKGRHSTTMSKGSARTSQPACKTSLTKWRANTSSNRWTPWTRTRTRTRTRWTNPSSLKCTWWETRWSLATTTHSNSNWISKCTCKMQIKPTVSHQTVSSRIKR